MIPPRIPEGETERLNALAEYAILDTQSERAFDEITLLASQVCHTPISLISFIDKDTQWVKSCYGLEITEIPRDISFCGHTILEDKLFEIPNTISDNRFAHNPLVIGDPDIYFYAGMPLIDANGFKLGTLCVIDHKPRQLTPLQHQSLSVLTKQIVSILEKRKENLASSSIVNKNNQLDAALEAIPDLVWIKDINGSFVNCNEPFAQYLGKTKSEVIGSTEYQFYDVDLANFYQEKEREVIKFKKPIRVEAWLSFANGSKGLFEAIKTPVKDTSGEVVGTLSIAHDVTERNRAEIKLRRKQEAIQTLNEIASEIFHENYKEKIRAALALGSSYLGLETAILSSIHQNLYHIDICVSPFDQIYDDKEYSLEANLCYTLLKNTNEFEVMVATRLNPTQYPSIQCPALIKQQSFAGVSLIIAGKFYGALSFLSTESRQSFDTAEIDFIKMLAAWVTNAIQNEHLSEELRDSNKRIELALESADLGMWDWHIPSNTIRLNERWYNMLGYEFNELPPCLNTFESLLHPEDRLRAMNAINAYLQNQADILDIEFRLQHKRGFWVWIHDHGKIIDRDANGTPIRLVGTHMDITERKATEEEIRHLAFYDALTGLPNRRLLLDRLAHAMASSVRTKAHGALLFIDLDNFKTINDTLGHDEGDKLLKEVSERLIRCVRLSDTVARLGGDEFVIMLEELDKNADEALKQIEVVGEKIIHELNHPYQLSYRDFHNTPSIGVTLFTGHHVSLEELLKHADMAMYQAKAAGRNCLRFFNPSMQAAVSAFAAIETDLRYALETQQFSLHYQPQIDIFGKLTGCEALLRWKHPQRGMVSPAEFIPVAEQTGLILPIGNWVLEAGCKQLVEWSKNEATQQLVLSINVSARQFRQPDFVDQVRNTLKITGANPKLIKLELTESMLVDDVEDVIAKMTALKTVGLGFSLDDFGTGFSSLSYLKRLPLDQLKIDQSFVRDVLTDPNDSVIVCTIVALAKSLGFKVIAEGVETQSQRDFLAENGCNEYQGYLFSKPLPSKEFGEYSKTNAFSLQSLSNTKTKMLA